MTIQALEARIEVLEQIIKIVFGTLDVHGVAAQIDELKALMDKMPS
jgi:uncharacterized protein YPO0396